jgi:benzoate-CoA ligase
MVARNLSCAILDDALSRGGGGDLSIREPKRALTYAHLAEETARIAHALLHLGIGPGDRVALLLHDSADFAAVFLAAMRVGAVPTPFSVLIRAAEAQALLEDSGAVALVVHSDLADTVRPIRGRLPRLQHLLAMGGARSRQGELDLHALASRAEPSCPAYEPSDDDAAFLLYSAGRRGSPRGVAHHHAAPLVAAHSYASSVLGLTPHDRVFTTSSLASAYGLGMGLLFPLLAGASTFLLPGRPRPRVVFDIMLTYHPSVFAAAPSLYSQMLHDFVTANPPLRRRPFESVRRAVSGAENLPANLETRLVETFGLPILHGFGATETLHFALSNRVEPSERRTASSGRPLPGVEARLVDDEGQPVPPGRVGALEVFTRSAGWLGVESGSSRPRGPECEGGEPVVFRSDGWIRTGDRFLRDEEGFFFHVGRSDSLFKVSGRWVYPGEVEETLRLHAAVADCQVVEGRADDGMPIPVAHVVVAPGHTPSTALAEQLTDFVKRLIAPYKYPRQIQFHEALPQRQAQGEAAEASGATGASPR